MDEDRVVWTSEEHEYDGEIYRVVVYQDCDDWEFYNPREVEANIGKMWVHLRELTIEEEKLAEEDKEKVLVLPIRAYVHGCIALKAGEYFDWPFTDAWDSSRAGYIWAYKGVEGMTDEEVRKRLIEEVDRYSKWLNCEFYEWEVQTKLVYEMKKLVWPKTREGEVGEKMEKWDVICQGGGCASMNDVIEDVEAEYPFLPIREDWKRS